MRKDSMKKLKKCFGNNSEVYSNKLSECNHCQFGRKCLLETKGKIKDE